MMPLLTGESGELGDDAHLCSPLLTHLVTTITHPFIVTQSGSGAQIGSLHVLF
jgi:hypothetical protein